MIPSCAFIWVLVPWASSGLVGLFGVKLQKQPMLSAVRIKGFKQKRTQVKRLAKFLHLPVAITLSALYTTSEKSGHLLTFLQLLSSDLIAYTNSPAKGKNKWHLRSCFRNAFRALLNLNFPVEKIILTVIKRWDDMREIKKGSCRRLLWCTSWTMSSAVHPSTTQSLACSR